MAVEIKVNVENVRSCAGKLSDLAKKIQNYKLGFTVTKSKGAVAEKTLALKAALEAAGGKLAALAEETSQKAHEAANTFQQTDEGMKY